MDHNPNGTCTKCGQPIDPDGMCINVDCESYAHVQVVEIKPKPSPEIMSMITNKLYYGDLEINFTKERFTVTEMVAEASDLGWPPGRRAASIKVDGVLFLFAGAQFHGDGEFVGWLYKASTGLRILVMND